MKKKYLCNKLFSLILEENSVGNNGILQKPTKSFFTVLKQRRERLHFAQNRGLDEKTTKQTFGSCRFI